MHHRISLYGVRSVYRSPSTEPDPADEALIADMFDESGNLSPRHYEKHKRNIELEWGANEDPGFDEWGEHKEEWQDQESGHGVTG